MEVKTTLTLFIIIASILCAFIYVFSNDKEINKYNTMFFKIALVITIINIILHICYD